MPQLALALALCLSFLSPSAVGAVGAVDTVDAVDTSGASGANDPNSAPRPRLCIDPPPNPARASYATTPAVACCKTCRKGKACGDSCIARERTCTKPPGCACDA